MDASPRWSRRTFLASASTPLWAGTPKPSRPDIGALRRNIVNSPVGVSLDRPRCTNCGECAKVCDPHAFEMVRPATNLFLFDWKETNPQLHESFTGAPSAPIRANLRRLHDSGARILLRCPMIPEYNARAEHLDGIAALAREMPRLLGVELLPYHRLGSSKAQRVGIASRMPAGVRPPDRAAIDGWHTHLRKMGVRSF